MSEPTVISSLQNPLVKKVQLLKEKARERKKSGLFVIEGIRELQLAQKSGYHIDTMFYCPELTNEDVNHKFHFNRLVKISKSVYEKLAYRGTTEGVLAIAQSLEKQLDSLEFLSKTPLILVAEAPEKPGNIGALLRTADAAKLDAVLIANPKTDLYNPNIIRSSVGCVFTIPIAMGSTKEILDFLKKKKIVIFSAALTASVPYVKVDFKKACAIVVGTEATGLSDLWLQNSDQNIKIPMQGAIDSLNVSVSAAILIFEAKRQRGF